MNPLHLPFSKCTKHKDHNDQDYMSLDWSFEGNKLVVTTILLLTATGHQRSFLSQARDSLVL